MSTTPGHERQATTPAGVERLRFDADHPTWIRPSYDGYGIVNLPWTLLGALGVPVEEQPLAGDLVPPDLLAGVRVVLLVVVDALGYHQLERAIRAGQAPTLAELTRRHTYFPLTSTFPSTTVAALTALQTGQPPSRHGIVGYICYLREFGMVSNMIRFSPLGISESYVQTGVDPAAFLPVPRIYELAANAGVAVDMVNFRPYARSPLTRIQSSGAQYHSYDTLAEFAIRTLHVLAEPGPRLIVAYWPMVDLMGHRYGAYDVTSEAEIRLFDAMLGSVLLDGLARDDLLVVLTADHGQVQLDPARAVNLNQQASLLADLRLPPAGERRAGYFYPRAGRDEAVREALVDLAGEWGEVFTREELLDAGLYGPGPVYAEVPSRVGDLVLIARGLASFPYQALGERTEVMVGAHGALEAEEMLVPCLMWRP